MMMMMMMMLLASRAESSRADSSQASDYNTYNLYTCFPYLIVFVLHLRRPSLPLIAFLSLFYTSEVARI